MLHMSHFNYTNQYKVIKTAQPCVTQEVTLTLVDTVSEFSWKFMMASEILTSIGSTTISMLNGPSSFSANFINAPAKYE